MYYIFASVRFTHSYSTEDARFSWDLTPSPCQHTLSACIGGEQRARRVLRAATNEYSFFFLVNLWDARHGLLDSANITFETTRACVCIQTCSCAVCLCIQLVFVIVV